MRTIKGKGTTLQFLGRFLLASAGNLHVRKDERIACGLFRVDIDAGNVVVVVVVAAGRRLPPRPPACLKRVWQAGKQASGKALTADAKISGR